MNSRLDETHAAVLRVTLRHLEQWNSQRRDQAVRYLAGLATDGLVLPRVHPAADPVWHVFVVRTADRSGLQHHLAGRGVETLAHDPVAPHTHAAYADVGTPPGAFPISDRLRDEVLSLPIGPHLATDGHDHATAAVRDVVRA